MGLPVGVIALTHVARLLMRYIMTQIHSVTFHALNAGVGNSRAGAGFR